MAARQENTIPAAAGEVPPPPATQEVRLLKVYSRCCKRHARVLDSKISRLEKQLNDELSKNYDGSSSSDEVSCCDLMDKIEKLRAKRDAIYADELQRNQQKN